MADYNMSSLVVGGIGKHRFLTLKGGTIITPVSNRRFNLGIGDWGYAGTNVISRVEDEFTQFGDYCLKVVDDDAVAEEYAKWEHTLSSGTLSGKKYVVYFWAKSTGVATGNVQLYSDSSNPNQEVGNEDIGLTDLWKPYFVIAKADDNADGTTLYLRFKPYADADGVGGIGTMYIDNVHLFEVDLDMQLKVATSFNQEWSEVNSAKYRLITNDIKTYPEGSVYSAALDWDYFEPPEELARHKIYSAKQVLFVPHIDYNWAILVRRKGKGERRYFNNRYIGHEGKIVLEGLEVLESDPPEIPSGAGAGEAVGSGSITWDDVVITT